MGLNVPAQSLDKYTNEEKPWLSRVNRNYQRAIDFYGGNRMMNTKDLLQKTGMLAVFGPVLAFCSEDEPLHRKGTACDVIRLAVCQTHNNAT